jgi:endonuclease
MMKSRIDMPIQRHNVVIPREDGGLEVFPLKDWLRQHPEIPTGLDPNFTSSHQLRNALRRLGWTMEESPAEIRLIKPGVTIDPGTVDKILGPDGGAEDNAPFFSLEYQLRDFLASNLSTLSIGGSRLRLFIDASGRDGIEFPTSVGPIDILATDDDGSFFVFELKRANSPDRAIGQVARYMGWVRTTIGKDRKVFGVIVARTISEKLRYAALIVPDVHLYEYQVEFHLNAAQGLETSVEQLG